MTTLANNPRRGGLLGFLTRTRGNPELGKRVGIHDVLTWAYLAFGLLIILGPVLWTVLSSVKPETALETFCLLYTSPSPRDRG